MPFARDKYTRVAYNGAKRRSSAVKIVNFGAGFMLNPFNALGSGTGYRPKCESTGIFTPMS